MKKILLPTDFSETSKNAIRCALRYFSNTPVEFVLLNAFGTSLTVASDVVAVYASLLEQVETNLLELENEIKQRLPSTKEKRRVRTIAVPTDPETAIKRLIQMERFGWVVIGTTGSGNAITVGSLATALVRANLCNVLVIPFSEPPGPLSNVVFATDYQPIGESARKVLSELVSQHQAELTFLTILADDTLTSAPSKAVRDAYRAQFADLNSNEAIESHVGLRVGIEDFIDSHYVDLLVTVCHHRSLLDVLLNRSLTRQLAYKPMIPLAVLADKERSSEDIIERSLKGEVLL
ncbi:universal stress protein [Spirosoma foliorum]|uniref:Universal stress protein n=1 Tax=Spirosoma foliorum TaxID=2710596 RepID=A0A7G5GQ82_9BACT|nr:universal stress protein [Spirosoma foliorum]QMW01024.1 universal stress protein [Spirosoma foliorum]